jgi:T5orf172 domain
MPYIPNTPESVLPRSDSKDPAKTCNGITVAGQRCCRSIAASARSRFSAGPGQDSDGSELYCWQHKEQAQKREIVRPARRTSIDTLIERFGGLGVEGGERVEIREIEPKRRPLNSGNEAKHEKSNPPGAGRRPHPKHTIFSCFQIVRTDDLPAPRPVRNLAVKREGKIPRAVSHVPSRVQAPVERLNSSPRSEVVPHPPAPTTPVRRPPSSRQSISPYNTPTQPSLQRTPASFTMTSLLELLPSHLSQQAQAELFTELAKPISETDKQGYIYIFWATPSGPSTSPPPLEIASALLPSSNKPGQDRRMNDAIRAAQGRYTVQSGSRTSSGVLRLKIGETSNVQRRLNQWRQCSHNLTVVRYYPYSPSSPSASPARTVGATSPSAPGRKTPHVHRVERLIHLELADRRIRGMGPCGECGRRHREWFEFEAKMEDLRVVDECVRKWVGWAERQG